MLQRKAAKYAFTSYGTSASIVGNNRILGLNPKPSPPAVQPNLLVRQNVAALPPREEERKHQLLPFIMSIWRRQTCTFDIAPYWLSLR